MNFGAKFMTICLLAGASLSNAADLPRIGFVFPAGGRQGTSFEVRVGGENIYGANSAKISGKDVSVEIVDSKDPAADKEKNRQRKKNQTVIDEVIKLKVTISKDAVPGDREIRVMTSAGVSNRLVFQIGQLAEVNETEPNDKKDKAFVLAQIPVVINGQIMSGDVDCYKFSAKKGQSLVFETSARALIPYIADAVPGWFQSVLTLYDAKGNELAFKDDYRFNPDPVLFYDVPEDGDYILEIRDSIYRGRADFTYRVKIGELPFITSVFPQGASRGQKNVQLKLSGKNLPSNSATADVGKEAPPIQYVTAWKNGIMSNRVPFAVGSLPEITESEPNDQAVKAQRITPPVIINGRIQTPGDKDFFSFEGKKDQYIVIDAVARRLNSPLDSFITLVNSKGEKIGENDDVKDKGEGLITHQSDSFLSIKLPENGIYTVALSDTQGKGGDEYAYRLRIGPPVPDFELRMAPSSICVQKGGTSQFTVYAVRKDGFRGEVKIKLTDNPKWLRLDGGLIPEGVEKVSMTVSASEESPMDLQIPRFEGSALIGGKTVSHPVVPSEDLMQAFIYQHLVPCNDEVLAVTNPAVPFKVLITPQQQGYLELPMGKETTVSASVVRGPGFEAPIQIQLVNPPKGITVRKGNIPPGKEREPIILRAESKLDPNLKDNLIFTATMFVDREEKVPEPPAAAADKAKEKAVTEQQTAAKPVSDAAQAAGKDNNKDGKDVKTSDGKEVKPEEKVKKVRKEKFVVTLPAVPIRIVNNPEQKKTEEVKKQDEPKNNKN